MPKPWKHIAGFVLCAVWLSLTVAFFAMLTSGGEANMDLEIGPFIKLHDSGAVFFCRGLIGFGIVMIVLFLLKRRIGFILAVLWSSWWAGILSTAFLSSAGFSGRVEIFLVVFLFLTSLWYSLTRLRLKPPVVRNKL